MIKRISGLVLAAALLLSLPVQAQTVEIFSEGSQPYKSVRLTPEVYREANKDLSDLRVKGSSGKDIPYFIYTSETNFTSSNETYPMELTDAYMQDDAFYFDYAPATPPNGDLISTSLRLETQSVNFAKDVTIFGSRDNRHWEFVQDDVLYSVEYKSKLELVFATPQKYTHYRLKLANNLEKIAFDNVSLQYNKTEKEERHFREQLRPHFTTEEIGQDTLLHIHGLKNLKLADITIEADSMFMRRVADPFGGVKELYNLSFARVAYHDTTIPLNLMRSSEDVFTLKISNHDDAPIHITGVTATYFADEIVFAAGTEPHFTLSFGDPSAVAPIYDIASYKDQIMLEGIDKLTMGSIVFVQPEHVEQTDYTFVFNIVLFVIAGLLGALILVRLRKSSNK